MTKYRELQIKRIEDIELGDMVRGYNFNTSYNYHQTFEGCASQRSGENIEIIGTPNIWLNWRQIVKLEPIKPRSWEVCNECSDEYHLCNWTSFCIGKCHTRATVVLKDEDYDER